MFDPVKSPVLTDLYQLNMIQAYLDRDQTGTAVFEFFSRKMHPRRGFYLAAGLETVLDFLEGLEFSEEEIAWLESTGRFRANFLDYLRNLHFDGDVHAMPEGTVFFAHEPILRITAPLPVAQLIETRIINFLHFQTLVASKAARMVLAAPGKTLVDFGLRRAHSGEAGLLAARAAYIAGFAGTATVPANALWDVPIMGTMAHSYIQAHDSESAAFENFARARPDQVTLLVDTYDTLDGVRKVIDLAPKLAKDGIAAQGIRLDSGKLDELAFESRKLLDEAGLTEISIFASGGLDEDKLQRFEAEGAPIDGYGIGTSLTTSEDVPALDCAYKLQEYAGLARRKKSSGKMTWPGRKQVYRRLEDGRILDDIVTVEGDEQPGAPLLEAVMKDGKRLRPAPPLSAMRETAARNLERLPDTLCRLKCDETLNATISPALEMLAGEVNERIDRQDP